MVGPLAVGTLYRGVEAGCTIEFAPRAAASVEVGVIWSCTDGAG